MSEQIPNGTDHQTTPSQPTIASTAAIVQWEPQNATEAWTLAKYYGGSGLLPKALKNTADIFTMIAAGRDFGWSPMQSLRGIYVVEGKPSLSADAMVGIAKKSGVCEYFILIQSDAKSATYEAKRKGDPKPVQMSFTIEEAHGAGLTSKTGPWKTYPARMLRNRAKSALAKELFEELFFGVYEEGEIEELRQPAQSRSRQEQPEAQRPAPKPTPASQQTVDMGKVAQASAPTQAHSGTETVDGEVVTETDTPTVFETLVVRIPEATTQEHLAGLAHSIKIAVETDKISMRERSDLADRYAARRKAILVPADAPVQP